MNLESLLSAPGAGVLGQRIVVRRTSAPERIGSLWLAPSAQVEYRTAQAEIVAVSSTCRDWRLQPGIHVICQRFGGEQLERDTELWCVAEEDILAIVSENRE